MTAREIKYKPIEFERENGNKSSNEKRKKVHLKIRNARSTFFKKNHPA